MSGNRTRREALKVVAASLPVLPVLGQQQHDHEAAAEKKDAPAGPYTPQALTGTEFSLLGLLVDDIIPRTDTPGAADAGAHIAIDKQCARSARVKRQIVEGLRRLEASGYKTVGQSGRIAILTPLSEGNDRFFRTVKDLVVEAYYSSKEGLQQELGWNANTYLPEFKGCTHPEHQG